MADGVIELLRRANPLPGGVPAPPIEPLLVRLEAESGTVADPAAPPSPIARRVPGVLGVAVAVAIVVFVAAVALTTGGHRSTPTGSASVPAGARQLVAKLAVLRRSQTAADRSLPPRLALAPAPFAGWRTDPRLTRLATTQTVGMAGKLRVYLVVLVPTARAFGGRSSIQLAQAAASINAIAVDSRGKIAGHAVARAATLEWPGAALASAGLSGAARTLDITIVPDRVVRVKWVFAATTKGAPPVIVYPWVRGNVAFAPTTSAQGPLDSVTWYGADGRVIGFYNAAAQRARLQLADELAIARSARRPIAPSLLAHFHVFNIPQSAIAGPAPAMPLGIEAQYAEQTGGLNVARARFIAVTGTEPPVRDYPHGIWVIPGRDSLCYMDTQFAGGCAVTLTGPHSPDAVGLIGGGAGAGVQWLTGVVPDGDPTVSVALADGTVTRVRVVDNVFSVAVRTAAHGRAIAVIARDAAGGEFRVTL